jgi:hypothetical protein
MEHDDRGAPRPTSEDGGVSEVACRPAAEGWSCVVVIGNDPARTQHTVTVRREVLDALAPGSDAERLVRASFAFLLEREPRSSILRQFDLTEIATYFPEYPDEIRRRLG